MSDQPKTTRPAIPVEFSDRRAVASFLRKTHGAVDGAHIELPGEIMIYTGEWDALAAYIEGEDDGE